MFILTEKPSVAEAFANALEYELSGTGIYVSASGKDCIVSAAGHVLTLFEPEDYNEKLHEWNVEDLPIVPEEFQYKIIREKSSVLKRIKDAFNNYDSTDLLLATDAEREGQYIGELILDYVHFKFWNTARRFWISSALSKETVLNGIKNARPLSEYASYRAEGEARSKADWLLGMNLSRLLTCSTHKLLTFGRVQTAVLGAVYIRDRNIKNFKPEPYYQLQIFAAKNDLKVQHCTFKMFLENSDGSICYKEVEGRLSVAKAAAEKNGILSVTEVTQEEKKELPPQLYNITGLQKFCSTKYNMTAKKTLETAQELYEAGCLSYPRTPSTVLGDDDTDTYRKSYDRLKKLYPEFSEGCDESKISASYKRLFNTAKLTDHHALIPLGPLTEDASPVQRQVYLAVVERFFCVIKDPYEYMTTRVRAETDGFVFTASGKTELKKGWHSSEKEPDGDQSLPSLKSGDSLSVLKAETLSKMTTPKKHFTESSLLALMENPRNEDGESEGKLAGLGTPATRADIIASLLQRKYLQEEKKSLIITELGIFLIETVVKNKELADLISIKQTTIWEEKLSKDPDAFLSDIIVFTKNILPGIKITSTYRPSGLGPCPLCGKGRIFEGKKAFFCSSYKETGCSFTVWRTFCEASITSSDVKIMLEGKKTRPKKMRTKVGREFSASLALQDGKVTPLFVKKK